MSIHASALEGRAASVVVPEAAADWQRVSFCTCHPDGCRSTSIIAFLGCHASCRLFLLPQLENLTCSRAGSQSSSCCMCFPPCTLNALFAVLQLDKLSPKQMQWLMAAASWTQRAYSAAQRAKAWLAARPLVMAAIAVLLLALLLRRLGWV